MRNPGNRPRDPAGFLPFDPDAPDERGRNRPVLPRAGLAGLVFVGGCAGTAARYAFAELAPTRAGAWPLGTFTANLVGAFVLGALLEALARAGTDTGWRRRARLLVGTGFCGGLTTYSTLAVETDLLVTDGAARLALGYLAATVLAGAVATTLGIAAAAGHRRYLDGRVPA